MTKLDEFKCALSRLVEKAVDEVEVRQSEYGDAWSTVPIDTLLHIIKNDAARLPIIKDPEMLKHRLVDIVAYCAFSYARTTKQEPGNAE